MRMICCFINCTYTFSTLLKTCETGAEACRIVRYGNNYNQTAPDITGTYDYRGKIVQECASKRLPFSFSLQTIKNMKTITDRDGNRARCLQTMWNSGGEYDYYYCECYTNLCNTMSLLSQIIEPEDIVQDQCSLNRPVGPV